MTKEVETLTQLFDIQSKNPPSIAYLPYAHNIYDVNLNTRTINGPSILSVQKDHKSEVVYFKLDRYTDYMDLTNTTCLIEYILPNDKDKIPHIYVVPFYDTATYIDERKILIPWVIGGAATSQNGKLQYAIRFFKIAEIDNKLELVYNLNTLPTSTEIKKGLEVNSDNMNAEYDIPIDQYESLIYQLEKRWIIL